MGEKRDLGEVNRWMDEFDGLAAGYQCPCRVARIRCWTRSLTGAVFSMLVRSRYLPYLRSSNHHSAKLPFSLPKKI